MGTNILNALSNIIQTPVTNLIDHYHFANRINNMGDALEYYVKDIFCGSLNETNEVVKNEIYNNYFSYIGNQNNPPDIIIRGGDAIEVKKIENARSGIALNSSYPKDKLYSNSPMITAHCRACEAGWVEKDIIYAIGVTNNNKLKSLWIVFGDCYAANKEIYERIRNKISSGINELEGVEFAETNELGRVNKVDPLGITYLRIRNLWHIENPVKVFSYIADLDEKSELIVHALMLKKKYLSFPVGDRSKLENLHANGFSISDVKIKSPNNPAELLEAKLIKFVK